MGAEPLTPLSRAEIEEGVRRFPRWFYPFDLGQGVRVEPTDSPLGKVNAAGYVRKHAPLWKAVLDACGGSFEGLSVLDAGCFQGYWSIEAARAGASRVVGFDLREEHVEQARFCARAIGLPNVEFRRAELFDLATMGTFDVVLLFGVLYHVDQPIELLRRARGVTRRLIAVNTDVLPLDEPVVQLRYEDPSMELNSATGALVCVPSVSAVVRMLRHTGFGRVRVLPPADAESYRTWRRAVFLAEPTPDGAPEPPPASVWTAGAHGYGERKLDWVPSGSDRAPLRTVLARKLRRLFDRDRAPTSEC
jgi:SAM-dependent methyltransferase